MSNHASSLTHASIDQQLVHLQGVIESLQETLQSMRLAVLPEPVYGNMQRIKSGLVQLRHKAAALEAERLQLIAVAQTEYLISSSLELDVVLTQIMDTIIRLTGAERAFLMLANPDGTMELRLARSWEEETLALTDEKSLAISRTIVKRVLWQRSPVLTTDAQEDRRFDTQDSVANNSLRSILCVPMQLKDQLTGLIYADNRVRAGLFTRKELDLVASFASQAAVAVENARLFTSLRQSLTEVTALKSLTDNVFGSITSAVLALDADGCIQICNPACARLLKRDPAELTGRSLGETIPALAGLIAPHLEDVITCNQAVLNEEGRVMLPGVGPVDLRFSLSPLKDESGLTRGVTVVVDDLTETKRLKALRSLFERMVSPAVIHQLHPEQLALGGERAEITVLFADLRGFTTFAEQQTPEQLVRVLNCYLAAATEAILREGGTVDKFLGDAVMAWFNAPVAQPDHTLRAVRAALGIHAAVEKLHTQVTEEQRLWFGCGIHVGDAVVGLVGSEQRLEYTAIGDCVNTAQRITQSAEARRVLVSAKAYDCVADAVEAVAVEPLQARGKAAPLEIYEILRVCEDRTPD